MPSRVEEEFGGTGGFPVFPRKGEPWFECHICGFDFPRTEAIRHYRSNRLVDAACADEKTHADFLAEKAAPKEGVVNVEQPVTCQGSAIDDTWYGGLWNEMEWYGADDPCERKS